MNSGVPLGGRARSLAVRRLATLIALVCLGLTMLVAAAGATQQVVRTVSDETITVRQPAPPRGLQARTAIVVDAGSGVQLWSRNAGRRGLVASTTKIMTALVAIEHTQPGQLIESSGYRGTPGESLLGLLPGEVMNARDLILGLLLESGNDAADTLALRTTGSRADFVRQMNAKARQLGLGDTHFENAIGLDDKRNYSTASDLAQLSRAALKVPRFATAVDRRSATLRSGERVRRIVNRNPMVHRYRWVNGVKTGHTMAAGYLLVASGEKLDAEVITVVTGEPTEAARAADSAELLRFGRAHFAAVEPLRTANSVAELPVDYQDIRASLVPKRAAALAASDGQRVTVRINVPESIRGPRSRGAVVGSAIVLRDGRQLESVPLVLAQNIPEAPFSAVLLHKLGVLLPWLLLLAGVLLVAYFLRGRNTRTQTARYVG